jgi:hypothetical protein
MPLLFSFFSIFATLGLPQLFHPAGKQPTTSFSHTSDTSVTYQSVCLHIIQNRIFQKYYLSLITWFMIMSSLDSMAHYQKSNLSHYSYTWLLELCPAFRRQDMNIYIDSVFLHMTLETEHSFIPDHCEQWIYRTICYSDFMVGATQTHFYKPHYLHWYTNFTKNVVYYQYVSSN